MAFTNGSEFRIEPSVERRPRSRRLGGLLYCTMTLAVGAVTFCKSGDSFVWPAALATGTITITKINTIASTNFFIFPHLMRASQRRVTLAQMTITMQVRVQSGTETSFCINELADHVAKLNGHFVPSPGRGTTCLRGKGIVLVPADTALL